MKYISNPILRGFNPDPSILRVGDDYYIATSTFEWFPGVSIHHSKDLVNWRLIAHPLRRTSQLDMKGENASCGVWAPCLSYSDGRFYLIYTDVKSNFDDTHNYLVTAEDICGEWSEPVYMHSLGFDPSLFHDDGRKWFVSMILETRKGRKKFGGIVLQEYSEEKQVLIGEAVNIFKGTEFGVTEGPHLYKRDGWYYLMTAEGGTRRNHAVTFARSRSIEGPYEVSPDNPILTSRFAPLAELQNAGHADIVETQNGEWYMVHLCSRPIARKGRCMLGRETSIQKMEWTKDGWLRLAGGGNVPKLQVEAPDLPECRWEMQPVRDDFDSTTLGLDFQSLRIPLDESMMSLTERPGYLRLIGRESLNSRFVQSLVARRQQDFCYRSETVVEFEPESFKQAAGLICMYDHLNYFYLKVTFDPDMGGKCLTIVTNENGSIGWPIEKDICLEGQKSVYLAAEVEYDMLRFSYSLNASDWHRVGPVFDCSILSDECCKEGKYAGAFTGICCQDQTGQRKYADFDYFEYVGQDLKHS